MLAGNLRKVLCQEQPQKTPRIDECQGTKRKRRWGGGAPTAGLKVLMEEAPHWVQGELDARGKDHSRHP